MLWSGNYNPAKELGAANAGSAFFRPIFTQFIRSMRLWLRFCPL
jgi:hypothetical protein